jgi:leucyl aminopeptidase
MQATSLGISGGPAGKTGDELLAVAFYQGPTGPEPGPGTVAARQVADVDLTSALARDGFRGKAGESAVFLVPGWSPGDPGPRRIAVIGIGRASDVNAAAVRDAAQRLASIAAGSATVATTLALIGPDRAESVRASAEGFLLGGYRVSRAGSHPIGGEPPAPPRKLTLLTSDGGRPGGDGDRTCDWEEALARGVATGQTVNWVRELVHAPAAEATPALLAELIAAEAVKYGATVRIWTAEELTREGFGGVIGVGQGSRNAPRMLEITHADSGDQGGLVAFAGKGITFDSGGLNLKRDPGEISWMRADMAGGAAVAAAVIAAARLTLPLAATAVVPLAENLPGGGALRPGDVLTHRGGRTSQVMDTDSEGRLVVADAIAYLAERNPAALIDVATLTDAAGLGPALWAAMGTDQPLLDEILQAGESAGEPGWPLPLPEAYRELLASSAADLRNTPTRGPDSTVMAATFLREFTGDTPWVHIDNGSSAWLEYPSGLWPEGATGSPTRALIRFLERRATRISARGLRE